MREEQLITVGDRIDLIGERNRVYKTMIEDVIENVLYMVGIPKHSGVPMPLHVNDEITLVIYRDSGRYIARMRVAGFDKKGDVRCALLLMLSQPEQDQRRGAYRLPKSLEIHVCKYIDGMEKRLTGHGDVSKMVVGETVSSRDISISGIGFMSKLDYELGEKRLLKIFFSQERAKTLPFLICGKVTRFIPWPTSNMNNVGMQYFGQTRNMIEYISKYVLIEQQKQTESRKSVEGP